MTNCNSISANNELRQRQEACGASLPKEPQEALLEIERTIKYGEETDSTEYAARAALTIISEMTMRRGLDDSNEMNDAIYWLTRRGLEGLELIENSAIKVEEIARQFCQERQAFKA